MNTTRVVEEDFLPTRMSSGSSATYMSGAALTRRSHRLSDIEMMRGEGSINRISLSSRVSNVSGGLYNMDDNIPAFDEQVKYSMSTL